ncbi:MAG: hypothetical protein OEY99_02905 [Aigarchaeota archaeon]|nr:hypothetical protein [Aigarchaeota archaeon]MDH5703137.1 hypothetical protein [Aigarchaeota archaeon]
MTSRDENREPPWIRTPWRILFEVTRLSKIKPWDIDLRRLINSFSQELRRRGFVDFSAAGVVLLSSSIIHRAKTESILEADQPKTPKQPSTDYVPPPIQLPVRSDYTTTTMAELVAALDKVLRDMAAVQEAAPPAPPSIDVKVEDFLLRVEEEMTDLQDTIAAILEKEESFPFIRLIQGATRLEAARLFILLLFIAARGAVTLSQDEDEELYVRRPEEVQLEQ